MKSLALFILLMAVYQVGWSANLVFATMHFPPYSNCENKPLSGRNIDLIRRLEAKASISITIRCLPWRRLMQQLELGTIDGAFPLLFVTEREQYAKYISSPLHFSLIRIASRKEDNLRTLEQLKGKIVGIEAGYFLSPALHQQAKLGTIALVETHGTRQNLKMLSRGRIDAYVDNQAVIQHFLKIPEFAKDIAISDLPLDKNLPAYLTLSKQSKLAMANYDLITRALQSINAGH